MEWTIRFREFVGHECRRCGELMADHSIRPLHVPELPDVAAAEVVCPMVVLDLGTSPDPSVYEASERR
jgi:hypothetical protein